MSSELLMSLEPERRILMAFSKKKNNKSKKNRNNHISNSDKHNKSNDAGNSRKIKEKITDVLELPKEVVLNISKMTMIGNQDLIIENYKGVVEYGSTLIRINTGNCLLKITGRNLCIKEITSEDIKISGQIGSLEFQN